MSIINFSDTPVKAFYNGFLKGLSAPIMLFGRFNMPELTEIRPIHIENLTIEQALSKDWNAVGSDLKKVIEINGKTTNKTT